MEKIVSLICLLLVTHSLRAGTPPSISPPLADQQVALAGSAMLSVSATGDAPLSYQWSLNGANLTSGTTSSYSLSYVQAADLGTYSIVVSNPYGSATNNAVLSAACTASPSGIIAWWPGETSAADYAGGFDAAQHSGVSNVPGKVNNCFYFDGSTDAFVDLGTTVGKFATNDFSVEFWEKVPSGTTNQCFIGNDPNSLWSLQSWQVNLGLWGASSPGSLAFFLDNDTQGFAYLSASRNVADGTWHHIACTRSNGGGAVVIAMYIDGTLETNTTASIISVNQPTWPVRLGNDQWYHTYLTNSYMDEVALYNRALSSNDVFAIYTAGTNGKCCANPVITAQPSNPQNIQNGSTAAFSVAVVGTPPLYYQWSNHTSGLISGATSSTFTIGSVGSGDRGTYSVYVWNNCETTNSTDAFLAFAPTNLSVSPAIQTNSYGNSFSFSVTASGDGPFSYQWWHLTSLVGTSSSYSSTVGYGDGGSYVVVVNNNGGTATSSGILYVPPHIVTQPNSRTAACNGSTNFSVVATGGSANQYQWFSSNSGLLAGKTASTLSINPVQALSSGIESYQVVVSNAYGPSVTSTWASLSVAPAITTQPANATACDGSTNTFIGAACGTQTLSYQWCYNGSSVSGATTTSLPVTCSLTTAGSYTLVVTNTAGSATSSPVTLFDMTPSVSQPMVDTNITVIQNNTITLISAGNLYPQWYSNGIAISGATNANLQLINVQPSYAASYNVVYSGSNSCGTPVTSSNITLFVTSASCTNLTNGMAGWWRGEGDMTDTISTNTGSAGGTITYTNGQIGQAFYFDGHANWISCGTNVGNFGTNDFTVQFWLQSTNSTETESLVSKRLTCDAVNSCFDIRLKGTGQILASVTGAGSSGLKSITTTGTANGRNPHHFAFVRSGTALNLYIDGALDTSTNVTTIANIKNTANFRIGKTACIGSDGTQYYTGRMDEIQVFNRALSIGEIQGVVTNSGGICIP